MDTRTKDTRPSHFRLKPLTVAIRTAIPVTLLGLPVTPQAGPEGGVVTAGSGTVARPDAQTTNIQQHSQNLILNWDSYNVQANEAVNYRQPNANAQALNRILDHNPSQIFGQINANGKVLLVNPNGVFFKPGARVNVGGLVASGLNISDKDFLAGKYHFAHAEGNPGAVINQGLIQAATGGAVSLIGGAVKNEGTILAHAGQVNLVAGKAMAMDFDGDGLIQFAVTEELLERAEGLEAAVSNTGVIKAEGGAVLLKGRAARDVFTQVVNNSGVIGAGRVEKNGGVIRLVAEGAGSSLLNTGVLNAASEKGAGGTIKLEAGGKVEVSGEAHITAASGKGRGGRIDISGGDVAVLGQARLDVSRASLSGGTIESKASNKAVITDKARITAVSGTGKGLPGAPQTGGRIDISGGDVAVSGQAWLDVSGGAVSGGAIKIKASNKVSISDKARITAASGTGKGLPGAPQTGGRIDISGGDVVVSGQAWLDVSDAAVSGGAIKIKASNKVAVTGKARITAASGVGQGGRIDISGGDVAVSGSARLDVSGASVSGGTIRIKTSNKVAVTGKARITASSGVGRGLPGAPQTGGQIDISGGEVSISDSALITAASGAGQARTGDALLNMDSGPGRNAITGLAGGTIKLKAQNKAVISDKAQITVASETGKGGQIEITGDKVGLLGQARLDASGAAGGGGILVGGDYQGKNPAVRNARITYIGKGARLSADAKTKGKGGRIIVWANDTTRYHGRISARSGAQGGDGGFVEVSGKRYLAFRGEVDVAAPKGRAGTLLLDPNDLCIGGTATSNSCGGTTANPTPEDTTAPFSAASATANSWVSQATLAAVGNANIILQASNNIFFDSNISLGATYTSDFRLLAGGSINMNGNNLTLPNGTARFYAGGTVTVTEESGGFVITRRIFKEGDIHLGGVTASTLYLSATGSVTHSRVLTVSNLYLNFPRPARTGVTGTFANSQSYTGTYLLNSREQSDIGNLYVGGVLGGDLRLADEDGFRIASPINTGADAGKPNTLELRSEGEITQDKDAVISGTGKLLKSGPGRLTLSAANSYSGQTNVNGGALRITHADALGTPAKGGDGKVPASATTLGPKTRLELEGGMDGLNINASESLTLNGAILHNVSGNNIWRGLLTLKQPSKDNPNIIQSAAGTLTVIGNLSLQTAATPPATTPTAHDLTIKGAGNVVLSGVISGAGGLIKGATGADSGTLTLSGVNTYAGTTLVNGGTLAITASGALGAGAVTVNSGGVLALSSDPGGTGLTLNRPLTLAGGALGNVRGNNTYSGALTFSADSIIQSTSGTLTVSGPQSLQTAAVAPATTPTGHNLTVKGAGNVVLSGVISGAGGLIKGSAAADSGLLTLSGANTYAGTTLVNGGTLAITRATALGGGAVTVNTGGVLALSSDPGGTGFTLNRALTLAGGALGNVRGNNTYSGALTLSADSIIQSASGTLTVSGNLSLQTAATPPATTPTARNLTVKGAGNVVLSGIISGAGGLTKAGTGRLTLGGTGENTYAGVTAVDEGILRISKNSALGTPTSGLTRTIVKKGATLQLAGSDLDIYAEELTLNGGTLHSLRGKNSRSHDNTWSRNIDLTDDSRILAESAFGAPKGARLTLGGEINLRGHTLTLDAAGLATRMVNGVKQSRAASRVTVRRAQVPELYLRYFTSITGTGGLIKAGGGQVVLRSRNDYTGRTHIEAGELILDGRYGASVINDAGAVSLNTATSGNTARLIAWSSETIGALSGGSSAGGNIVIIVGRTLTVNSAASDNTTYSGVISEGGVYKGWRGNLAKTGPGRLTLGGANTYTGTTTINNGVLAITNRSALGTGTTGRVIVNSSGANSGTLELRLTGTNNIGKFLTLNGLGATDSGARLGALRNISGINTWTGAITLGATAAIHNADTANALTISGVISGINFGLTKIGPGTLTLNATNTYTGATRVDGGELELQGGTALHDSSAVVLAGAGSPKLTVTNSETIASLAGGGEVAIASGQRLTINQATNTTYRGVISGAGGANGGLSKTGAGALTLSGANTYAGTTNINAGKLIIAHSDAADATTPGNSSALGAAGAGNGTIIGSNGVLELQGDITRNAAGEITDYKSQITLAEDLTLNGGTLRNLHGAYTLTGAITLGADSVIDSARDNTARIFRLPGIDIPVPRVGLPGSLTLSGVISSGSSNYGLTKIGLNDLSLSGANTYRGDTVVAQGALTASHNTALGATVGGTIVYNNASLNLQGNITIGAEALTLAGGRLESISGNNRWNGAISLDVSRVRNTDGSVTTGAAGATSAINALLGNLRLAGAISLSSGAGAAARAHTLEISSLTAAAAVTISGNISGAGGNLTKLGGGKLTLSGTNTYTGDTNINDGELELQGGTALHDSSAVVLASIGSPKLTVTNSETIASLAGGGEVAIASGQILTVKNSVGTNTIYSGVISGAGGLTKGAAAGDTGRLTLGGNNTYGGATRVDAGTLRVTHNNALGTPTTSTAANTTTVARNATLELSGNGLNVAEALNLGGTLANPSGNNEYSGDIALTRAATLSSATAGNTLTVSGGVTLETAGSGTDPATAHALTVTGAGDTAINGAISGAGGLSKTGSGTLTLGGTAANTYAGVTAVNEGILRIGKSSALGTPGSSVTNGGTTVAAGATLELAGGSSGLDISSTETLSLNGAGVSGRGALRNVSGNNTWRGAITLAGNTIITSANSANTLTLASTASISNGARLLSFAGAGDTLVAGVIGGGAGGLSKTGAGTLTLNNTGNNYTGDTNVNEGTLKLGASGVISDRSALIISGGAFDLAGNSEAVAYVRLNSGSIIDSGTSKGVLSVTSNDVSAQFSLYSGTISAVLAGQASPLRNTFDMNKRGPGRVTLSAANTFTARINVFEGALRLSHGSAAGNSGNRIIVFSLPSRLASLELANDITVPNRIELRDSSSRLISDGNNTLSGPIVGNEPMALPSARAKDVNLIINTGNLNVSGRISGANLSKSGAGTLTLSNSGNNYTGATNISAGTLALGVADALPGGSRLVIGGSGTFALGNFNQTLTGGLQLANGGQITGTGVLTVNTGGITAQGGTISANLAGNATLTKTTANTLTLSGTNTRTGATTIEAGTLSGAVGTGAVTFANASGTAATLVTTGDQTIGGLDGGNADSKVQIQKGSTLTINNSGNTAFAGVIEDGAGSGRGNLTKTGAGRLTLSGANTYTGLTTVSNGILRISHNTALGGGTGSLARTIVASGARLELSSSGTTGLDVGETLDLFGTLANQSGDNEYSGAITLKGTTIDSAAGTLTVSGNLSLEETVAPSTPTRRDLRVTGAGDVVLSGVLSGLGGIIKGSVNTDTGVLTVSGNNTFAGAVNVNHGTLRVQHNNALGTPGGTTTNGGTTVAGGATLALDSPETVTGTSRTRARLTIPAGEALNLAGTLRNRNAGSGAPADNIWNGTITLTGNNATIDNAVPASGVVNSLTLAGNITGAFDLTVTGAGNTRIQGNIQTGAGSLSKRGAGTLTLSGSGSNYTGATTISAGALALGVANALPGGSRLVIGGSGTFALGNFNQTLTGGLQLANGGQITGGTGVLTVNTGGITAQGGTISANLAGNATLTKTTANTLTLSGTNTRTGATTIEAGTLSGAVGTGAVTFANAGGTAATLVTTGDQTVGGLDGGNADSKVQIQKGSTLTINNSGNTAFAGVIEDGAGSGRGNLTKTGAGRLTLSGANTYTGLTTVSNGILRISHNTALGGGTGSLARTIVASGARLELSSSGTTGLDVGETLDLFGTLANQSGDNEYSGAITLKGTTIDSAAGVLTVSGDLSLEETVAPSTPTRRDLRVTGAGDVVLSGVISGLGGIIKGSVNTDTGVLTVSGNNTFAGAVNVNHGTLRVQHNNALGTPGGTTTNGGTTVAGGATLALAGGTGNLSIPASEALRLAGTLRNLNALANNTWNGAITLTGNATIESLAQTLILSGNIGLNSGDTATRDLIVTGAGDIRIQGNIQTGAGGLSKTGAGTLTLNGTNTYTGATRVEGGMLKLGQNDAINKDSTLIVNDGTFDLAGWNNTFGGVQLLNGTITDSGRDKDGATKGALTLSGGNYDLQDGTVNAILAGGASVGLTKRDRGTVTLTAANTYGGETTINAGTLKIQNAGALGNTASGTTVNDGGTLELDLPAGTNSVTGEALTLNGTGDNRGTLRNTRGTNTWDGAITLAGNGGRIDGAGGLTLAGPIDGTTAGQQDLRLAGSLTARFNGTVGGGVALRDFTVAGATQVILNANLTATRRVTFSNITAAEAVNQTGGVLRAAELLLRDYNGRTFLTGQNDVRTLAGANLGGQLNFAGRGGFTVGTVGDLPGAPQTGVSGITTNNAGVNLRAGLVGAGTLTVGADIRTGSGEVRLANQNGDINGAGGVVATSSRLTVTASGGVGTGGALRTEFTGAEAGSLNIQTQGAGAAGSINLVDPGLNTRVLAFQTDPGSAQTVRLSTRHSGESRNPIAVNNTSAGTSNLDANDTLVFNSPAQLNSDINTNNPALSFNGPVTTNANRRINTGRGALTFRSTLNAGANTLALTSRRLTLTDDITASALDMSGSTELVIAGNSPTLNVNPVNIRFPNTMTGRGALTIPGVNSQNFDVGAGLRLPANMRGYRGHLIIGGRLTPEGMSPWHAPAMTGIKVNALRLSVSRAIETGGPVTLLGGDIGLNANIRTGGQLGLLAVGPSVPGLAGSRGVIEAPAGPVTLTLPARASGAFIASERFVNAASITLAFAGGQIDVATRLGGGVGFNPNSAFAGQGATAGFVAFLQGLGAVLGADTAMNVQPARAFLATDSGVNPVDTMPAAGLPAPAQDGLFGQELTLLNAIGGGIALALANARDKAAARPMPACCERVTLEELDLLIAQLEARLAGPERRPVTADTAGQVSTDRGRAAYRRALQNFLDYRAALQKYTPDAEADLSDKDFGRSPGAGGVTDEIARLNRALAGVRARLQWLESLSSSPAERDRPGRAAAALVPERLTGIIEATRAQAVFIENQLRRLFKGAGAMLPAAPDFKAEAGGYESIDIAHYGEPLNIPALMGGMGWY